ncbi:helix-turn-helix transcriptional regulator [Actinacidiphila cocklensis]|uniref:Regulatory LuxR family protein n=1 Tax=Actinacidiphila cocklensis TaxID=887465 RepID=A0A9W4GQU6_9ACTN|nr:LuxR family transcriptional regulator [Actinacidiphila cocklensis]CAG6391931.1 Regulatory LuxR family protein [Actinacidiphila cocklensis]
MEAEQGRRDTPAHPLLRGRAGERHALAAAVAAAGAGRGATVLVVGEPGSGRSTLLAEASRAARSQGLTVRRAGCTRAEARVPLAGLHGLLLPLAGWLDELPDTQSRVLRRLLDGRPPAGNTLMATGTALVRLLAAASAGTPLLWCVDDAQWLDEASLRVVGFALRRLGALPVAAVVAADGTSRAEDVLEGAEVLRLASLDAATSFRVITDRCRTRLGAAAAREAVDLACGNPLALTELAAALDASPGRAPRTLPPYGRLRAHFRLRLDRLTPPARAVVALTLLGGSLRPPVLLAAAARLGAGPEALDEARAAGLVALREEAPPPSATGTVTGLGAIGQAVPGRVACAGGDGEYVAAGDGATVAVAGRLARACLGDEVGFAAQQAAHAALADTLGQGARLPTAVHRLAVAAQPSQRLIAEMEAAASDVRQAGDPRGCASALERAAEVTAEPGVRARWLIAAAADRLTGGEAGRARGLLDRVLPGGTDPDTRGLRMLVRGEMELRDGVPARALHELTAAAAAFPAARRDLTTRALMLAGEAGCLGGDFAGYFALAERVRRLGGAGDPPAVRLVLGHFAGMAATFRGRHDEAGRSLRQVVGLTDSVREPEALVWGSQAAYTLGDAARAHALAGTAVHRARELGAVSLVPAALVYQALSALMLDRYAAAEAAALEGLRTAGALGQRNVAVDHLAILALLAALRGDAASASLRLRTADDGIASRGLGRPGAFVCWVAACVDLAEERPADALDRFRHMTAATGQVNLAIRGMAAPHFVEAAVRCHQQARAAGALRGFEDWAVASGSTVRRALAHRCHGLLAEKHATAEEHFQEALRLHDGGETALERAKTELFYAHRLRRARKPGAARGLLRDALTTFRQAGARTWADRAAAELRAAGAAVDPLVPRRAPDLTAQQERICELVTQGATNREIADLLVLSPRTVDYHLRNIFVRLGVRSRVELAALLR